MRTYTVHHRLTGARDLTREVEGLVFVKEGFCWPGLFFPAFWLLFRGLWLVLIGYLVVAAAIVAGGGFAGLPDDATMALGLAINLLMGFEGNDLRRWTLGRRGLRMVGLVSGRRVADAERRFLETLVDGTYAASPVGPARPERPAVRAGTWARPETEDEVIGLFPGPESAR